jgi:phage gp29-like protein
MTVLVDHRGQPLRREVLTREIAGPTLAGVRSPIAGYPADGMNPVRLANLLRAADGGDPLAYFELAEQIEERDLHYVGVLGQRKRSAAQVAVTVEAASDEQHDVQMADMVRGWLDRDELADEMFDVLDAVGKGQSFTEIIWDTSEGQFMPARLEWRDPRFFTVDPLDLRTPMLRGGVEGRGVDEHLAPFKFIHHQVKAKSGLPIRSGLARIVAWAWMFKAFTQRDWAIFTQTYGQPIRIGKYASGASKEDRATLWRAVANIAGDCAAIVPDGMVIEFIESKNVGVGAELYENRADWLDRQVSKAVVGQTGTTDSKSGGLGDGGNKVHGDVAQDIKNSDCKGAAATLNRDLIRPWVQLERGPQKRYPRLRIEEPEAEDLSLLADSLAKLVPLGLRVQQSEVRDKFGLTDPDDGADVLHPEKLTTPPMRERIVAPSLHARQPTPAAHPAEQIADGLASVTEPEMRSWLGALSLMMSQAGSLAELREMVVSAYPTLDAARLVEQLAGGFSAAHAAGISDVEDDRA